MLVRDLGEVFALVLQPDHAELSGQIATAWAEDPALSAEIREALRLAATRHDDGWAIWERHPRLDARDRPQAFHDVPVVTLLSSYAACVDVVCAENPAAGLLVSMHVTGLRRNRYGGVDGGGAVTPLAELESAVREFVVGEERRQGALAARLRCDEAQRWRAYRLLQVYDLLSLYLGLADLEHGESGTIPVPPLGSGAAGQERTGSAALELVPGAAPWTVCCDPFPFATVPTCVRMSRRLLSKHDWPDEAGFRVDFAAAQVEEVEICLTTEAGA